MFRSPVSFLRALVVTKEITQLVLPSHCQVQHGTTKDKPDAVVVGEFLEG